MNSSASYSGIVRLTGTELAIWVALLTVACTLAIGPHLMRESAPEIRVRIAGVDQSNDSQLSSNSTWRLDLNAASAEELTLLPGIGQRRAQLIMQERRKRGAFTSVWQLCEVPSLSKPLVQRIAPLLRVSPLVLPAH